MLPERDSPAEIRKMLRALRVDFTLIHPEAMMVKRYAATLSVLHKEPGDELDEIGQRAFRHLYESLDVS
ncbi:hypothetical protein [uncultured Duncaniella sp.]|uniref:hypothetical protein n=1 Tax=uncultured Duncaniella sp. TaxID=2768039 RepID=UPI00260CA509|nr:hypothetical protein [uncultured Duncaniella sp.]